MSEVVFIWELPDGRIAAVLNPEGKGEVFLQIHPALRTPELEDEMLAVAEERLAVPAADGRRLRAWAQEQDGLRREILLRRGYTKGDWPDYARYRPVSAPIPEAPPPPGYTVRALGDVEDHPARILASRYAFHPDDPIERRRGGWEWYRNVQRAPLYRRDLDIVAVAPGGEIASFCTVWFDDRSGTGSFEPVGTVPAHQRRGLGKAVMCEGLRRLLLRRGRRRLRVRRVWGVRAARAVGGGDGIEG